MFRSSELVLSKEVGGGVSIYSIVDCGHFARRQELLFCQGYSQPNLM